MPDTTPSWDNPKGHTRVQLKDGTRLLLKGENLSASQVAQGVAAWRSSSGQPDTSRLPVAPNPKVDMKTSRWPGIVRKTAGALPVVGGIGGAILAAPETAGVGSVAGGAAGAVAGESAREMVLRKVFGPEGDDTPKGAAAKLAAAGAVGGLSELPGAIAQGYGTVLLRRLAQSKSAGQIGDVLRAFNESHPFKVTKDGLRGALEASNRMLSKQLGGILKSYSSTVDLDSILSATQKYVAGADQQFATQMGRPGYKGVSNMMNRIIAAAKTKVGIPASSGGGQATTALARSGQQGGAGGTQVTVKELADFQSELRRIIRYERHSNPTVAGVVEDALKQTARDIGQQIDAVAPEARPVLNRMTDIHGALSALKRTKLPYGGAVGISAALHPRATAALSPAITAATPLAVEKAKEAGKGLLGGVRSVAF